MKPEFLDIGHEEAQDRDLGDRETNKVSPAIPRFTAWGLHTTVWGRVWSQAVSLSWGHGTGSLGRSRHLEFSGSLKREESPAQWELRALQRTLLESSAEDWSIRPPGQRNQPRPGRELRKRLRETIPLAHTGLGIVWVPMSQNGEAS